jgi:hypothetical protein
MGPTSTPQSLFIVQAMLIRQLLFLGFYRPNVSVWGGWSSAEAVPARVFLRANMTLLL